MGRFLDGAATRPPWQRYLVAFALTGLVIAGRLALNPWWGHQHNRHLVFLPTIMLAAWLGGLGPGLLSAALSTAALATFWIDAEHGSRLQADLILFVPLSVLVCVLIRSLQVARAHAESARLSREHVLAVVAHDLRNPLAAAMIASESIQRAPSGSDTIRRRAEVVNRALARMERLIGDLLEGARIEQGELAVVTRKELVDPIVQEAMDLHADLARAKGLVLAAETPGHAVALSCDRDRLLQALGNLLGNALKFTSTGGRVVLKVDENAQGLRFAVDDTGPGIPAAHLPHIFKRHWNTDSRGLGLGLYIAQTIIRAHGSEIGVRSEPGQGASFFFTLPR
jgi:signal transduction histidine kinase